MLSGQPFPSTKRTYLHGAVFQHLWRANELAASRTMTSPTGFAVLDHELPNAGWPCSSLIEFLLQQAGIGEMQLLKPALVSISKTQKIALVQPPYLPHSMACRYWGIQAHNLLWIQAKSTADALWSTEQILKNGSCGAVILWQSNIRTEALRRLNLAAQATDTWLWLMRPLSARSDSSPSPLRIALRPALAGVSLEIVKRRGPHSEYPLFIPLADMPTVRQLSDRENAPVVEHTRPLITARSDSPILV